MIRDVDRYMYKGSMVPNFYVKFSIFEHLSGAQEAQQITKKGYFWLFFDFLTPWSWSGSD